MLRFIRTLFLISVLAAAVFAQAMQGDAKEETPLLDTILSSVTPTYLENSGNPYSLKSEAGWQVGGFGNNFNFSGGLGTFNLRGGYYITQGLAPRQVLDNSVPLPDVRNGEDLSAFGNQRLPSIARGFFLNGGTQLNTSDQISYQRMDYQVGGLRLQGSYADVGANVKGLDALVRQMNATDPDGAKLMKAGTSQTSYNASYAAGKLLNFATGVSTMVNDLKGDANYGLTRQTSTNGVGLAFGKAQLNFTQSSTEEAWDPDKVKRDTKTVDTQTLAFTSNLGQKSKVALTQSQTSTRVGTNQTDDEQQSLSLQWAEWKNFGLQGTYTAKETAQTGARSTVLNLDMNAAFTSNIKLTGKFAQAHALTSNNPTLVPTINDLLALKLDATLLPNLQLVSQYQDGEAPDKGEYSLRDQQLTWAFSRRWKAIAGLTDTTSEKLGDSNRTVYGVIGDIGTKARPQQLSLTAQQDELPNNIQQQRTELGYSVPLPLGQAPVTMQVRAGDYTLTTEQGEHRHNLLAVQLFAAKPLPDTTLSLGYMEGPVLGAGYLTYRAWGQRQQGNLINWRSEDLNGYNELGGELVRSFGKNTKLAIKQYSGKLDEKGEQATTEYGLEQRFGAATFQGGRRMTLAPTPDGAKEVNEDWWRFVLPFAKTIPEWAKNAARFTAFEDGSAWTLAQLPTWSGQPTAGMTIERRNTLIAGKQVDYTLVQSAVMVGTQLLLQGSYEQNPPVTGQPQQINPVLQRMWQATYRVKPKLQVFGRFTADDRLDHSTMQHTQSWGLLGQLSGCERLHLQVDTLERTASGNTTRGTAYLLGYERKVSDDDSFLIRYRMAPEGFTKPEDRVKFEMSYRKTF